jgi:hypothetical protein
MRKPDRNTTVELPGEGVRVTIQGKKGLRRTVAPTLYTDTPPFERISHLLSDRPSRRPNRTRPVER